MNLVINFLSSEIIQYNNFVLTPLNLLIIIGIIIGTQTLLKLIKKIVFKKFEAQDLGRSNSVYQIVKYVIWVVAILFSLQNVGFNLSILVAGSAALMVGIGFGLQNIFNDFTSGIFILIEGTINVGDIIEADGIVGKVTEISLRTSKVLTRDDTVLIIPNHKFISDQVINWSDNKNETRFSVTVGVAYGSDVQKVKDCLLDAAHAHPHISNTPKSNVRFISFGDSSLDFELFFWSEHVFRIGEIESDLRFAINDLFIKNDITIPFPQRDVRMITN
ncbi:MAG: small-conductance mechanosensitive channel [Saprospiraceae bacterium]|jgi:small-conductance mechanosensitive channel